MHFHVSTVGPERRSAGLHSRADPAQTHWEQQEGPAGDGKLGSGVVQNAVQVGKEPSGGLGGHTGTW